jgi:hypothetical protein
MRVVPSLYQERVFDAFELPGRRGMVRGGKSLEAEPAPEVTPRSGARLLDAICPNGFRCGLISFALPGLALGNLRWMV